MLLVLVVDFVFRLGNPYKLRICFVTIDLSSILCNPYKSRLNPVTIDFALCIHSSLTMIMDTEEERTFVFTIVCTY